MKIVIMADSLALPRPKEEGDIPYEATYPFLLEQSLRKRFGSGAPIIIERGMRRRTIEYVLDEWVELIELRDPNALIVQVGIVDCAPRVFLRRERQLVENLRPERLRRFVLDFVHKHRAAIIKRRKKVYVSSERFSSLVQQVISKAKSSTLQSVIFVNIIVPPESMNTRSPGFIDNVHRYNEILAQHCDNHQFHLLDLNGIVQTNGGSEGLTTDGIHLNRKGHELLACELETRILATAELAGNAVASLETVGGSR